MAKDDYDVIVYRILVYLYACMKHKIMFENITFEKAVRKNIESDEYVTDILVMMQKEGLITGVIGAGAWGESILVSEYSDLKITVDGIHYLKENSTMKKVGETLKETVDIIAKLAGIIKLF